LGIEWASKSQQRAKSALKTSGEGYVYGGDAMGRGMPLSSLSSIPWKVSKPNLPWII
jgi:hypothetical protein